MSISSQTNADATPQQRGYVVCTTQRTGSNFLLQLLSSTGVLGKPLDYFNAPGRRKKGWVDYPNDRARQLEIVVSHGATNNGVYGFKLFAYDFDTLAPIPWTKYLPNLRWIFLYRTDLLGQAISLALAKETDNWRSTDGERIAPPFNAVAVDQEVTGISRDNADWLTYFARNALEPLMLRYEDVVDAPDVAVRSIASLVGVESPPPIDWAMVDLTIQRDAVDAEWRARYCEERANLSLFRGLS